MKLETVSKMILNQQLVYWETESEYRYVGIANIWDITSGRKAFHWHTGGSDSLNFEHRVKCGKLFLRIEKHGMVCGFVPFAPRNFVS